MIVLAIHSTSPTLSAAVVEDGRVLAEQTLPPGRHHLENAAPLVADLTRGLGYKVSDVDGFGVALGPGSFSGIRIGLATVKGLALALRKPLAGISSLEILAWKALGPGETGAAVLDARREQLYVALYCGAGGRPALIAPPVLLADRDLRLQMDAANNGLVTCGEDLVQRLAAVDSGLVLRPASGGLAAACGILAWERLKRNDCDDLHGLLPIYIRRSDAEEKKADASGMPRDGGQDARPTET